MTSISMYESPLFECLCLYWLEAVLLVALVAITIFRREMSCNHCYSGPDGIETTAATSAISNSSSLRRNNNVSTTHAEETSSTTMFLDWDDEQAESIIEVAEKFYTGTSILLSLLSYLLTTPFSVLWYELPQLVKAWWKSKEGVSVDELLDGVGHYCSGRPLFAFSRPPSSILIPAPTNCASCEPVVADNVFTSLLPSDATIHILSFLHPKDIVAGFGCTSKACHQFVENGNEDCNEPLHSRSEQLWKNLFERDYAWLLETWEVGRQAKQRSFETSDDLEIHYSKDFYFRFGMCYLNYLLAGQNSTERCLVGIGGHVFDLTQFLSSHPGSIETVLVHAGRDATSTFESMRHTTRARRIARQLCVVIDLAQSSADTSEDNESETIVKQKSQVWGLRPTAFLAESLSKFSDQVVNAPSLPAVMDPADLPMYSRSLRLASIRSVEKIRNEFLDEEVNVSSYATRQFGSNALGEVNVYYDPLQAKWKAWYICSSTFENQFVDFDLE